jgi:hypothetical protein
MKKTYNTPQPLGLPPVERTRTLWQQYDDCCDAIKEARDGLWRPTKKEMDALLAKRAELNKQLSSN